MFIVVVTFAWRRICWRRAVHKTLLIGRLLTRSGSVLTEGVTPDIMAMIINTAMINPMAMVKVCQDSLPVHRMTKRLKSRAS
jgi:hypothetical protein